MNNVKEQALERECLFCGKKFIPRRINNTYCCKVCVDNASKVRHGIEPVYDIKKTCPKCGREFNTRHKRKIYCSESCLNRKGVRSWDEYIADIKREAEIKREHKLIGLEQRKEKRECAICGTLFVCLNEESRKTCSHECSQKYKHKRQNRRIPPKQLIDKDITLEKLYKRDRGICYICGLECNWEDYKKVDGTFICGPLYPSIEHTVPLAKGGLHSWENVRLAHFRCNWIKGVEVGFSDMTKEESRRYAREHCANKKEVIQYINDVEYARYESTVQAEKLTGFKSKSIQNACRGDGTSKGSHKMYGYFWYYAKG